MKNRVTRVWHQNTKNQTVILIFTKSCPYLLICCVICLKVWCHGAECTDNWQVPWNGPWSRTARMVRRNNMKRKERYVYYYWWHTRNHNFCCFKIGHSHVKMAMTKTLCWPKTKKITIKTVLIKNLVISHNFLNQV